jgi:hypothetical protein
MAWTARTWITSEIVTAAMMNTIRDDLNFLLAADYGENTVYIPAGSLVAETGSEAGSLEVLDFGTIVHYAIPFDKDTDELVNFNLMMPKRYDHGSVYIQVAWTTRSGEGAAGDVVWFCEANKLDDGDALGADPASGDGSNTDAWQADGDFHRTAWFEVTPAGSISDDNPLLEFRVARDADNGSDDLDCDALLLGIGVRWTSDLATDD